jgi:hypothetical protein
MENKEGTQQATSTKKKWYAPYIVAGLIIGGGTAFAKTLIGGELVLLGAGIGAFFLYRPLKSKIKIKNEAVRVIITFCILLVGSGMLVGLVGGLMNGLVNKYSSNPVNTEYPKVTGSCQDLCDFNPTTKAWGYKGAPKPKPASEGFDSDTFVWQHTGVSKNFETQEQCLRYCGIQNGSIIDFSKYTQ